MEAAPGAVSTNTKTHRRLRKAYCRLVKEKEADKISVSSLTEEADISRATFYLHYQNIEEFIGDTQKYIISLFVNQIKIFLYAGIEEAKQVCKKKNLIFTDDDFELFYCFFSNNKGFGLAPPIMESAFYAFSESVSDHFDKRFLKKNQARFDLFFIGYAGVMRENFLDYHSDKVYRDILRSAELWDFLFPKHKFKD